MNSKFGVFTKLSSLNSWSLKCLPSNCQPHTWASILALFSKAYSRHQPPVITLFSTEPKRGPWSLVWKQHSKKPQAICRITWGLFFKHQLTAGCFKLLGSNVSPSSDQQIHLSTGQNQCLPTAPTPTELAGPRLRSRQENPKISPYVTLIPPTKQFLKHPLGI